MYDSLGEELRKLGMHDPEDIKEIERLQNKIAQLTAERDLYKEALRDAAHYGTAIKALVGSVINEPGMR